MRSTFTGMCTLLFSLFLSGLTGLGAQSGNLPFEEVARFTKFGYEEGYPEAIVLDIIQDGTGFIWIATADGLFRYNGYEFTEYRVNTKSNGGLQSNVVFSIAAVDQVLYITSNELAAWTELDLRTEEIRHRTRREAGIPTNYVRQFYRDQKDRLWMASDRGLLMKPPGKDTLITYWQKHGLRSLEVEQIYGTSDGRLWIKTDIGLDVSDPEEVSFQPVVWDFLEDKELRALYEEENGMLWVGTDGGLFQADPSVGAILRVGADAAMQLSDQSIRAIERGGDGRLYVGTSNGLNALDFINGENEIFQSESSASQYLAEDRVSCLFTDRQGLLWVGTWGKELQYLDFQQPAFRHLLIPFAEANDVNAIQGTDQALWLGTEYGGLIRYKYITKAFKQWTADDGFGSSQVYALELWKGKVWAGKGMKGFLSAIDPETEQLITYTPENSDLPDEEIWAMAMDQDNHLWIAGTQSIYEIEDLDVNGQLVLGRKYTEINTEDGARAEIRPRALLVDQDNHLWVGTSDIGLLKLDLSTNTFTHFGADPEDPNSCPGDYVNTIYEDRQGQIWVGTAQGAGRLNQATGQFTVLTEEDGLPNNYVFSIVEDIPGRFWLTTNRGLVQYLGEGESIRVFTDGEGLPVNEFNKNAGLLAKGLLYYGTVDGMVVVNPQRMSQNPYVPPIVITKLKYRNRKRNAPAVTIKGINHRDEIQLKYSENILEMSFAALNYFQSAKNRYRYQLQGFSKNWVELGENRSITFSGLDPGLYTLKVQGSNNDGVWNEVGTSLKIRLRPPFWLTNWAFFFYILFFILLLVYAYRYILRKQVAKEKAKRQQELEETKMRFFTNIAHEFKNPLTMIFSMAHELEGNEEARATIIRHGSDIRRLVNQVLDLRRSENDQLPIELVQLDIVAYSRQILTAFEPVARQNSVQLQFKAEDESLMMDMDRDKWQAILSNLISNAIKYNKKEGIVTIAVSSFYKEKEPYLRVLVRDTGRGIPEEALPQIFDRFFQVDHSVRTVGGTGVGLALVKEFVILLGGTVSVKSKLEEGSEFAIQLPIQREARLYTSQMEDPGFMLPALSQNGTQVPRTENTLLIVEDNREILQFLEKKFAEFFRVFTASDGAEGISIAVEQIPDLIISDVMMPKKDGIELLESLKKDERTSHIPIILLTAKSAIEDRIRGLEKGADRYLRKPFIIDELWAHIRSLLESRKNMQRYFQKQLLGAELSREPVDPFLSKAQQTVMDHLGDEDFNASQLQKVLNISRTHLYQKLTALTGKPASHFIRDIRLVEGRKLLLTTNLNISEVAYRVGFKDPGYFTTCYKELFNETPSDTRK